jgi:hypothetical protein
MLGMEDLECNNLKSSVAVTFFCPKEFWKMLDKSWETE